MLFFLNLLTTLNSDLTDNDILHSVHRFRPNFLSSFHGLPPYYDPYEFKHTCLLKGQPNGHIDAVAADEDFEPSSETKKCVAVPYVTSNHFHSSDVAKMLATVIKEVVYFGFQVFLTFYRKKNPFSKKGRVFLSCMKQLRAQYPEDASSHQPDGVDFDNFHVNGETCVYFIRGSCNRGNYCPFSHSLQAKRPQCKFFLSLQVICLFELDFIIFLPLLRL